MISSLNNVRQTYCQPFLIRLDCRAGRTELVLGRPEFRLLAKGLKHLWTSARFWGTARLSLQIGEIPARCKLTLAAITHHGGWRPV
jgi:hypothetical protein